MPLLPPHLLALPRINRPRFGSFLKILVFTLLLPVLPLFLLLPRRLLLRVRGLALLSPSLLILILHSVQIVPPPLPLPSLVIHLLVPGVLPVLVPLLPLVNLPLPLFFHCSLAPFLSLLLSISAFSLSLNFLAISSSPC